MGAAHLGGTEIAAAGGASATRFVGPVALTVPDSIGPSVASGSASRFLAPRGCAFLAAVKVRATESSTGRSSMGGIGRGAVAAVQMNLVAARTGWQGTSTSQMALGGRLEAVEVA